MYLFLNNCASVFTAVHWYIRHVIICGCSDKKAEHAVFFKDIIRWIKKKRLLEILTTHLKQGTYIFLGGGSRDVCYPYPDLDLLSGK